MRLNTIVSRAKSPEHERSTRRFLVIGLSFVTALRYYRVRGDSVRWRHYGRFGQRETPPTRGGLAGPFPCGHLACF